MTADIHKQDSSKKIQPLQKELDALKADHEKIEAKLKSEQTKSAQLLDNVETFIDRATKSDKATAKEKFKHLTVEKKMTEDAATIKSLKSQLRKVDYHMEEIKCQAIEDYLQSREFEAEKMQIFMDESKSYQDKCREAGSDLSIIAFYIKRGYGLPDSSRFVDPPPLASDESDTDRVATRADGVTARGHAWGSGPRKDAS